MDISYFVCLIWSSSKEELDGKYWAFFSLMFFLGGVFCFFGVVFWLLACLLGYFCCLVF